MLGPLIPWLREALHISYAQAAYHSVAMSAGVAGTALMVQSIANAIGRKGCVALALACVCTGTALVCSAPVIQISLLGCVITGAAAPLMITVAPAIMTERHAANTGIAMAEANAVAYAGFLFAPAFVSLAAQAGSWRWSFVPSLMLASLFWLAVRNMDLGVFRLKSSQGEYRPLPRAYWAHWLMLMLSICAELALITFGPSYLETVLHLPRGEALWASMVFPAGMALGRLTVAALLRRVRTEQLVLSSIMIAMVGTVLVVLSSNVATAYAGLFIASLGIAGLYPFGITLAMQAARGALDQAAARASLASGLATLTGPLLVGLIADQRGLSAAFGIVPMFLGLAALAHLYGRRAAAG